MQGESISIISVLKNRKRVEAAPSPGTVDREEATPSPIADHAGKAVAEPLETVDLSGDTSCKPIEVPTVAARTSAEPPAVPASATKAKAKSRAVPTSAKKPQHSIAEFFSKPSSSPQKPSQVESEAKVEVARTAEVEDISEASQAVEDIQEVNQVVKTESPPAVVLDAETTLKVEEETVVVPSTPSPTSNANFNDSSKSSVNEVIVEASDELQQVEESEKGSPLTSVVSSEEVETEGVNKEAPQTESAAPAAVATKIKELSEPDLAIFKETVRQNGSKSKEALIKELRSALPKVSERQITLRLNECVVKARWDDQKVKTWRLKEDVSPDALAAALASGANKTDKPSKETKQSKTKDDVDQNNSSSDVLVVVEVEETPKSVVPEPVIDPRVASLSKSVDDLTAQVKSLFTEAFDCTEGVRDESVIQGLAKNVSVESFASNQPSEPAMKLVVTIAHDSRKVSKSDLALQIQKYIQEANESASPDVKTIEAWIDLSLKRIDYFDDYFAFEAEKKALDDTKSGRSRRGCLRNSFALVKTLSKFAKDLNSANAIKLCDKAEQGLKDATERLTKVQREWYNRERDIPKVPKLNAGKVEVATPSGKTDEKPKTTKKTKAASKPEPSTSLFKFFGGPASAKATSEAEVSPASPAAAEAPKEAVSTEEVQIVSETEKANLRSKRRSDGASRLVVLYLDSRVKVKRYKRGEDGPEFFSKLPIVNGRRPFGKLSFIDYEVDSEDEEGESLSSEGENCDDEEEEDGELDFEDGFLEKDEAILAAERLQGAAEDALTKHPPIAIGVCFDPSVHAESGAELSTRTQPFEPCTGVNVDILMRYPVIVRKRTLEECLGKPETKAKESGSPNKENGGEVQPKSAKKAKPAVSAKKPVVALEGEALKTMVEVVEGSSMAKAFVVEDIMNALRTEDGAVPVKSHVEAKLAEIATKAGSTKPWVVKDTVLAATAVERKSRGFVSVYDSRLVVEKLRARGIESITEIQIRSAEEEFYRAKLAAAKEAKEIQDAKRAAMRMASLVKEAKPTAVEEAVPKAETPC